MVYFPFSSLKQKPSEERFILTGLMNNLFSQGSGGYDYMEWTSNATPSASIPLLTMPVNCKLIRITCNYLGLTSLVFDSGESWAVKCVVVPENQSGTITNSQDRGDELFRWDSDHNNTYPSTSVDCDVDFTVGERVGIVGVETGTALPENTAEAQVCLVFKYTW